jgi:hypothetical protein
VATLEGFQQMQMPTPTVPLKVAIQQAMQPQPQPQPQPEVPAMAEMVMAVVPEPGLATPSNPKNHSKMWLFCHIFLVDQ